MYTTDDNNVYSITGLIFSHPGDDYEYMNFDSTYYINKFIIKKYKEIQNKYKKLKPHPLENQPRYKKKPKLNQLKYENDTTGLYQRTLKNLEEEKRGNERSKMIQKHLIRPKKQDTTNSIKNLRTEDIVSSISANDYGIKIYIKNQSKIHVVGRQVETEGSFGKSTIG